MKAVLLVQRRVSLTEDAFVEFVVWKVPKPVRGSKHGFKYRLAYVADNECALRYDNEAGKGDHRHMGDQETAYRFTTVDQLLSDFLKDVERVRK
jgi:hypothetical protein